MSTKINWGVVIGRFQVDDLANQPGYIALLDEVKKRCENVLIILGEAATVSKRNPLNFHHRREMFNERYSDFLVEKLNDEEYDADWNNNLNAIIERVTSGTVMLYGNRDSFIHYYRIQSNKFPTEYLEVDAPDTLCATAVREQIKESLASSPEIRHGIIHSRLNIYDIAYSTVDILITRKGGTEVLLGQKKQDLDKGVFRILGGFFEKGNGSAAKAAARELWEESSLTVDPDEFDQVTALEISNDWRYRSTTDTILTNLFTLEVNDQDGLGGDDIPHVQWFRIEEAGKLMADCHKELWAVFVKYLSRKRRFLYASQTQDSPVVATIVVNPDNGKHIGIAGGEFDARYDLPVYVTEKMLTTMNRYGAAQPVEL